MQAYIFVVVGVIISVIGGCSLAAAVILKHLFENAMLKYFVLVCYQRILSEQDMSWDTLSKLYQSEMEQIIGLGSALTPPEGHELVVLLDELCEKHQPRVRWNQLIRDFDESIPGVYRPADGLGQFIMSSLGMIFLLQMLGLVGQLGVGLSSKTSQTSPPLALPGTLVYAIVTAIVPAIFLATTIVRLRWFLKVRKALLTHRMDMGLS